MQVFCKACGALCVPQSEEMMNGRDDLYVCPLGHTSGFYSDEDTGEVYQNYWPLDHPIFQVEE